jgi:hypothetical protein
MQIPKEESKMSKASTPAAPDYTAAATAQGQANVAAAQATAHLSNPNVTSPYGNQTVQWGTPTFDQAGYDKAMSAYSAPTQATGGNGQPQLISDPYNYGTLINNPNYTAGTPGQPGSGVAPTRDQYTTIANPDTANITQTLTPQAQQTLDAQQKVQTGEANLGLQGLGTAQQVMGTPFSFGGPGVQTSLGNAGNIQGAANPNAYNSATQVGGSYGNGGQQNLSAIGPGSSYGNDSQAQYGSSYGNGGTGNNGQIQGAPNLFSLGQAGANVQAGGINQGPNGSQYGMARGVNGGAYGQAQGGVQAPNLQNGVDMSGISAIPTQGGIQSGIDTSGIAQMPVNAGTTGQAAIMSRLAPLQARQMTSEQTALANQGLVPGDQAYTNAMTDFTNQQNDAQQQAVLNGIGLDTSANQQGFNQAQAQGQFANTAQAQGFGQGLSANQQGFSNALQSGQFGNQAQLASFGANLQNQQAGNAAIGQNYSQGLSANQAQNSAIGQNFGQSVTAQGAQNAAQQQGYAQQLGVAGLQNQAVAQNQQTALSQQTAANAAQAQGYNQNLSSGQFYNQGQQQNLTNQNAYQQNVNAAQGQQFNQNLQGGQFGNTAQQQALSQALQAYNIPLNQITALMSGSQIQNPQFPGYTGANVAASPIANAATQQAQYNQGLYGLQQGAANSQMSGAAQLGSSALMAYALS